MKKLTSLIKLDREFAASVEAVIEELKKNEPSPVVVNGLSGGAESAYVVEAVSILSASSPVLVIAGNEGQRDKFTALLTENGLRARSFKSRDFIFHNVSASHENERERLSVLRSLASGELDAVVATSEACITHTVPYSVLSCLFVTLKVGTVIAPQKLCDHLLSLGFVRVDTVESAGQFAARGGIVDFCINDGELPIRVEFFGDEIDRMVSFDLMTQRSVAPLTEVELLPAVEIIENADTRKSVLSEIDRLLSSEPEESVKAALVRERAVLVGGGALDSRDRFINVIYPERTTLLDYFSSFGNSPVMVVGTSEAEERVRARAAALVSEAEGLVSSGLISKKHASYSLSFAEYSAFLSSRAVVHLNTFSGAAGGSRLAGLFGFRCRRTVNYGGSPTMLVDDVKTLLKTGYRVIIASENRRGAASVSEILSAEGITHATSFGDEPFGEGVTLTVGELEGFDLITPRVALLSMSEDSGRRIMQNRRRARILKRSGGAGERIMSYADLSVGDYVVHANYGIGLFEGMESVRIDGVTKDYITIKYAGTDKLFVPCDRLELIGKYIGARESDGTVKLSKMGGTDWHKARTRAKSAVKDIAKKLIALYAERQRTEGFAFPPDSEMEDEFASRFEFVETDSQTVAIEEIKRDMMSPRPMNRLLCGDVGFGKTEVALRAAFKAIMGGKQVAILVPTTILALQHYETALARMRGYPVNVEMISRFRTPTAQARIIEEVKSGRIDLLIGTHKLLGNKIKFRDLGLLIIDEEQRFGVAQKEKLKEISVGIDVLTLSATPIPRTLNMAMNGISDMSVLDEAPENRRPVQTYVLEHDDTVINDAVRREIARRGQVLYLHNDIDTISYTADKIMNAIPEARVAYAHGRMEKDELEDIWQLLVRGEIDVLVCTTIIETGVDLPSANTLIIENADKMGLSQLHQIRGRVGRSERQAYAYFTYRRGKVLTEVAAKRLSAIREYAEFGAGFRIALCDLEIRGAGNLLGAEQHGYIDSVGYDLYVKLLSEAVLEEKGEKPAPVFESTIDIKVDAHIPEYYVQSAAQRMEMYKKISYVRSVADSEDLYDEMTDRFGTVPKCVERLLSVALCRAVAESALIARITLSGSKILFYTACPDLEVWSMVLARHSGKLYGNNTPGAPIAYRLSNGEDPLQALTGVMTDYYNEKEAASKQTSDK